jgi:hypothetical protein
VLAGEQLLDLARREFFRQASVRRRCGFFQTAQLCHNFGDSGHRLRREFERATRNGPKPGLMACGNFNGLMIGSPNGVS